MLLFPVIQITIAYLNPDKSHVYLFEHRNYYMLTHLWAFFSILIKNEFYKEQLFYELEENSIFTKLLLNT